MKKLARGSIAVSPGTLLYTVPPGFKTEIEDIVIANTTAGALTVILYFVPSGGAVAASNTFLPTVSIAANSSLSWEGSQQLNTGDFIQGIGSGAGLTAHISGTEDRA